MELNHDKYPIVIGARYENTLTNEIGILESASLIRDKNDAEIIIDMDNCGCFYKLNYSTFTFYWVLID
jgi:hypothetical protein